MENLSKKQLSLIYIFIGIIALGWIIYLVAINIYRSNRVAVEVKYAPFTATVQLNNKTIPNNSTTYIKPGQYQLTISLAEFDTITREVTISQEYRFLFGSLQPNSDLGRKIAKECAEDYKALETIAGQASTEHGLNQRKKWPIIDKLPVKNPVYSLGYKLDQNNNFTLTVNTTEAYIPSAIQELFTLDEPENILSYPIEFVKITNPFTGAFSSNTSTDPLKFLQKGYQSLSITYEIKSGDYYQDNYYYTTIATGTFREFNEVDYRVVLEKKDQSWSLITTPSPVITKPNAPNLPDELLKLANHL